MTLAERLRIALADRSDAPANLLAGDTIVDRDRLDGAGRPAAVLIAVTDRDRPGVILTQRTDNLRNHAGQIAFPGGRIDPEDEDAVAAALREAWEEVALDPAQVSIVGTADRYRTVTGFDVTPVVGIVPPVLDLRPAPAEVSDVFEVPLDFLLDHANHRCLSREWQGSIRHYYEILWEDRRVWGATAAMIVNLARRLAWAG